MTAFTVHRCTGEDYPPGGVACLCIRGEDHDESLFDVPKEEPA